MTISYNDYFQKELKDKIYFSDTFLLNESEIHNEIELLELFIKVMLNEEKKLFCKIKALQGLVYFTLIEKIKVRKTVSSLLDNFHKIKDTLLKSYYLKCLSLFYIKEKDEIKALFIEKINDENNLIKAEANYKLGLLLFFDLNETVNKDEYIKSIQQIKQLFEAATIIEENRVDAKLLSLICEYIEYSLSFNMDKAVLFYEKINSLLYKIYLLVNEDTNYSIYINIGRIITRIHLLITRKTDIWIDYKKEFKKLCDDFYEIQNLHYENNDFYNKIIMNLKDNLEKNIMNPAFQYHYRPILIKINIILSDKDLNENLKEFLYYLKNIIESGNNEYCNIDYKNLKQTYSMAEEIEYISKDNMYHFLNSINRRRPNKILEDIIDKIYVYDTLGGILIQ